MFFRSISIAPRRLLTCASLRITSITACLFFSTSCVA